MSSVKFRSWTDEGVCVSPDYIDRDGVAHWKENSIPTSSEIVEQFIGQLDQNSKEIYEGDILEWTWLKETKRAPVLWDKKRARFYAGDRTENLLTATTIIGDIHRTPELLK